MRILTSDTLIKCKRQQQHRKKWTQKKEQARPAKKNYLCFERVISAFWQQTRQESATGHNMDKTHAKSHNKRERDDEHDVCGVVCIAIGIPCQILFDSFKHK